MTSKAPSNSVQYSSNGKSAQVLQLPLGCKAKALRTVGPTDGHTLLQTSTVAAKNHIHPRNPEDNSRYEFVCYCLSVYHFETSERNIKDFNKLAYEK